MERWEEEASQLLVCVSTANQSLLQERKEKENLRQETKALEQQTEELRHIIDRLTQGSATLKQQLGDLQQQHAALALLLANMQKDELEEVHGAGEGEETEVCALRRRLGYWRERDKTRATQRHQEIEEDCAREASRFSKRAKLDANLEAALLEAASLREQVAALQVGYMEVVCEYRCTCSLAIRTYIYIYVCVCMCMCVYVSIYAYI